MWRGKENLAERHLGNCYRESLSVQGLDQAGIANQGFYFFNCDQ